MNPESTFERRRFLKEGGVALLAGAGLLAASASKADATQLSPCAEAQGTIILRSPDGTVIVFAPSADTDAARGTALREAIAAAANGDAIEISIGRCEVGSVHPLSYSLSSGVTEVKITFGEGAAVLYGDAELAREDWALYVGETRNVVNFGAVGDNSTICTGAFQAANNALPLGFNQVLGSGREHRTGIIHIPCGNFLIDDTIFISPSVHVRGSGGLGSAAGCYVYLKTGSFTNASTPQFMFEYEQMVGVYLNNHFGSQFTGVCLASTGSNAGACGLKISGAQGCLVDNSFIGPFAIMGADIDGPSIGTLWIAGIERGPGLLWGGGGSAKFLIVEHINPEAHINSTTGDPYPAIHMAGLYAYHVGLMSFEGVGEDQHFLRIDPGYGVNIGQIIMGTSGITSANGVGVVITGDSQNISIEGLWIPSLVSSLGVLIRDDSSHSPAGANNLFNYNGNGRSGTYNQANYMELAYKAGDNFWSGQNRFVGPRDGTALELGGSASALDKRYCSLDFLYDSDRKYRITPWVEWYDTYSLRFLDRYDQMMARFHPDNRLEVTSGIQSNAGYLVMGGPSNPTTSDIPAGYKQTWINTTTGEVRDWANIGGTLVKSAAYT